MNIKKNIIIVGYPKSGNTWITRLIAELVDCPVVGFWKSNHKELAVEGKKRNSDFSCFKSHHQLNELGVKIDNIQTHVIYVIRDPRDIVISGADYFKCDRFHKLAQLFTINPKVQSFYYKTIYKIINLENWRINKMIGAVLYGDRLVDYWCRIPWKNHYIPYSACNVLFIKYEDMLSSPMNECRNILNYLNLYRDDAVIAQAVDNQSFDKKKALFIKKKSCRKQILCELEKAVNG